MSGENRMRQTKDTTRNVTIPEVLPYLLVKFPILMDLRCFGLISLLSQQKCIFFWVVRFPFFAW